jgi:hypothetical protein
MIFNARSDLAGQHAFLSPSGYHWINYDEQKLRARFVSSQAARRGTELHDLAHQAIKLGVKLPKSQKTLNMYVNDAIGYKMDVEQLLYYSNNCFGHADAISFRRQTLRIHDLKTGITPTSHHQLEVYAALFCLEYSVSPYDIEIDLRIYQNDEVRVFEGIPELIERIMNTIVDFDLKIESMKEEGL